MYRYRQVVDILINYNISRIYIYRVEEREKRKKKKIPLAISGQRVDAVGVLKRTTGFSGY